MQFDLVAYHSVLDNNPSKTRLVSQFREPEERYIVYEHFAETNETVLCSLGVADLEKASNIKHLKSEFPTNPLTPTCIVRNFTVHLLS